MSNSITKTDDVHPTKGMTVGEAIEQLRLHSKQEQAEQKMLDFMMGFRPEGEQTLVLVGGAYPQEVVDESKRLLDWENKSIWAGNEHLC